MTAPVALLSVSPAYADTKPAAQTEQKPSLAELRKAVKEARQAYRAAVAAEQALEQELDATTDPSHPLMVAVAEAKKAADDAAAAKTAADQAVTDAQTKLDAATTDDEKTAAQAELDAAKKAADEATTKKTEADAAVAAAETARDDNRVAIARKIDKAQQDVKTALAAKEAAEKALADAKGEEPGEPGDPEEPTDPECSAVDALDTTISGLPSKIAAGSTVDFRMRLTNNTGRTLDEVMPFVAVGAVDKSYKDISSKLHLKSKQDGQWKSVPEEDYAGAFSNVKAGAHVDLPLRLTIDRSAPAGYGATLAVGVYGNEDETCGTGDLAVYEFTINPVGAGNSTTPAGKGNKPKPQGSASPVAGSGSGNGSADADGSLASTGSSSALPTIGLVGGAAVVLGAGAVYVVRRRKAEANG
ncbi:LPXTG cell wall anchor domain-containing protein [Streptomyces sp. NPDC006422]|uniref:LPXTG cell wall anchor domain-containing protein n=1 Tax=unclassified Streptomyces TaxID=2593676 RepID=UPI0033B6C594